MTLYRSRILEDGSSVIVDNSSGADVEVAVLKPGQWEEVHRLPHDEQRAAVEQLVIANRADPTGGRTERDEQTMDTARDASSGEAHQEAERS